MTRSDPEREEREGLDQMIKEQNSKSTTTVIKVTKTYLEAGIEAFIVRMTSILTHYILLAEGNGFPVLYKASEFIIYKTQGLRYAPLSGFIIIAYITCFIILVSCEAILFRLHAKTNIQCGTCSPIHTQMTL